MLLKKQKYLYCLSQTVPCFSMSALSFENTMGKGEIARNEEFLLFPECFLPVSKTLCHFHLFEIVVCKLFKFGRV